jgi:GNAT superfamily N-acetyltransferase
MSVARTERWYACFLMFVIVNFRGRGLGTYILDTVLAAVTKQWNISEVNLYIVMLLYDALPCSTIVYC